MVGFAALTVASASAMPVSSLSQLPKVTCRMRGSFAIRAVGAIGPALVPTVALALTVATLPPMVTARALALAWAGTGTAPLATVMADMGTVALALGSVSASDAVIKPRV